ncbi:MAG: rod shape-determining protein MreC [Candidatus Omnitrophica bacterium]|nr:rod shape-determining protein MreC [Candidatus Omnitrophota bacterium]
MLFSCAVPSFRNSIVQFFRAPLGLIAALKREFEGVVFYHRNYIQNRRLRNENDLLKNKLNESRELFQENKRLRQLLGIKKNYPYKVIAAAVIGRDPSNWSSVVIIDKGKNNGVKPGYVAVSFLGLAGKVVETGNSAAKVMLVNDPNFAVSAQIQRTRQEGAVFGGLGGVLTMKYLTKTSDVKSGDVVVTSGLSESYPKGLLIGSVVESGEELSGLSRFAVIKPAVEPSNIEEILIIIP